MLISNFSVERVNKKKNIIIIIISFNNLREKSLYFVTSWTILSNRLCL